MTDTFTPSQRRAIMSRVRNHGTLPELVVRKALHAIGYRFRLTSKDIPGKPDIVLPKYRTVIFVNGCFWHGHPDCRRSRRPTTNTDFWNLKLDRNILRDMAVRREISAAGWSSITVWECETKNTDNLRTKLLSLLPKRVVDHDEEA